MIFYQREEDKKVQQFNALLEQATVNQDPDMRDALIASAGAEGVEYDELVSFNKLFFKVKRSIIFRINLHLGRLQLSWMLPPLQWPRKRLLATILAGDFSVKKITISSNRE